MRRGAAAAVALAATVSVSLFLLALYSQPQDSSVVVGRGRSHGDSHTNSGEQALPEFAVWRQRWTSASSKVTNKDNELVNRLEREGVQAAKARTRVLSELIESDPEAALSSAFSPSDLEALPASVRAEMETWVSGYATVEVLCPYPHPSSRTNASHTDSESVEFVDELGLDGHDTHTHMHAESESWSGSESHSHGEYISVAEFADGRVFSAYTYGRRRNRPHREPLFIHGISVGDKLAIQEDGVQELDEVASVRAAQNLKTTKGESQRTLVCPVTGSAADERVAVYDGESVVHFASTDARDYYVAERNRELDESFHTLFTNYRTTGEQSIIIIIVRFANENSYPTTQSNYKKLMSQTDDYWIENSYGAVSFATPKYVKVTLDTDKSDWTGSCPFSSGKSSALDNEIWSFVSQSEGAYDRYVMLFSSITACEWAGLGSIAASGTWINGVFDVDDHWHVLAHELGHNFGLKHANLWVTNGQNSAIGAGTSQPYGDDFDIMGGVTIDTDRSTFHVNAHKKNGLDWIPNSDVTTITTTGQYRLFVHDRVDADGTRALVVRQGATTTYYWLEYRRAIAYGPAEEFFKNGVNVHWIHDESSFETETDLIDCTAPFATSDLYDTSINNAALQLGSTLSDETYDIHFTPMGFGAQNELPYVDVYVYTDANTGNSDPVISDMDVSCDSPGVGESILISVSASDPDGDELAYYWSFGDGEVSPSNAAAVSHKWAGATTFVVSVTVSDRRGGSAKDAISVVVRGSGPGNCPPCPYACNSVGQCSGGVCECAPGFTDASCGTALTVTSVAPNYGPTAGGSVVTVTGSGFGDSDPGVGVVKCRFEGVGIVSATWVSNSEVVCDAAPALGSYGSVVVEVTPNQGLDYSNSDVVFTYGGGIFCPANCSGNGDCESGPATCTCNTGYTGDDCGSYINATTIGPSVGPACGNVNVRVNVTGFDSVSVSAPACRFGSLAPVSGTYADGAVWCVAPEFGGPGTVDVAASPNGVDWTAPSPLQLTTVACTTLYVNLAVSHTLALDGDVAFFRVAVPDGNMTMVMTASPSSGQLRMLVGVNEAAIVPKVRFASDPGAGAESVTVSPFSTPKIKTGYIYATVFADGGAVTFNIEATHGLVPLVLAKGACHEVYGANNQEIEFKVEHSKGSRTTVVWVTEFDPLDDTPKLTLSAPDGEEDDSLFSDSEAASGSSSDVDFSYYGALQGCHSSGVYQVTVKARGGVFSLCADSRAPPSPYKLWDRTRGEVVVLGREPYSVNVTFPWSTHANSYDFNIGYNLFLRPAGEEGDFVTPCDVRKSGTMQLRKWVTFESFSDPEVELRDLDASTSYELIVVARGEMGEEAAYTIQSVRTKPPSIPLTLIYFIIAGVVGLGLLAGCVVVVIRTHHTAVLKKMNEKKKRRAAAMEKKKKKAGKTGKAGKGGKGSKKRPTAVVPGHTPKPTPIAGPLPAHGRGMTSNGHRGNGQRGGGSSRPPPRPRIVGITRADFAAAHPNELSFRAGQHINVIMDAGNGWLQAEVDGRMGLVPRDYVELVKVGAVPSGVDVSRGGAKRNGRRHGGGGGGGGGGGRGGNTLPPLF